jgi:hypothetical protein
MMYFDVEQINYLKNSFEQKYNSIIFYLKLDNQCLDSSIDHKSRANNPSKIYNFKY